MTNPDALKTAFDAATSRNEWATALVVVGLIVEFLALLFFSKEMPRKEKVALVIGSIMVAVGVGGEYVFGGRAASAAKALQQASDEKIAGLKAAQEKDHKIAAQAAEKAGSLGVYVGNLQTFVAAREREIGATFAKFKTFAADEKKHTDTVIADLTAKRAEIDKARTDAVNSASQVTRTVAAANAALEKYRADLAKVRSDLDDLSSRAIVTEEKVASRELKGADENELKRELRQFSGLRVELWRAASGTPDMEPLANRLLEDFSKSGWVADGVNICATSTESGVVVVARKDFERGVRAAQAIVARMTGANIPTLRKADFADKEKDFFQPLGCRVVTDIGDVDKPDLLLFVGSKVQ